MALSSETERKLRLLNLSELISIIDDMERLPESYNLTFDEKMDMAIDSLYSLRMDKKIKSSMKRAGFKWPDAEISSMFFLPERQLNKETFLQLSNCVFIETAMNIVIYGPTGDGKSYAACAIGKAACKKCKRVKYIRFPDLCEEIAMLEHPWERAKILKKYINYDLLIIDEWLNKEVTDSDVSFMFDLVDARECKAPIIFCSQYRSTEWLPRLGGGPKAESIVDKFVYDALEIEFNDFNMRDYMARENPKKWC